MTEKTTKSKNSIATKNIVRVSLICFLLVFSVTVPFVFSPVSNASGQTTTLVDGFEDGTLSPWQTFQSFSVNTNNPYKGDYSAVANSDDNTIFVTTNNDQYTAATVAVNIKDSNNNARILFQDRPDSNNADLLANIYIESGNVGFYGGNGQDTGIDISYSEWVVFEIKNIDYSNQKYDIEVYDKSGNSLGSFSGADFYDSVSSMNGVDIYKVDSGSRVDHFTTGEFVSKSTVSGNVTDLEGNPMANATVTADSVSTTTDDNGSYSIKLADGTYDITANKKNYKPQTKQIEVNGSAKTVDFSLGKIEKQLSIEGPNFVRPNQTIPYKVEYTNETGTYDVSNYSNITSANTTLLSIDETNKTLLAGGQNATVKVTAKYNTTEVTTNVTKQYYVSYLKLENIDTVPPAKWMQAFLGFDDGYAENKNMKGIGSDIQWLLFTVIIMSTIAKLFDNPWAGIGSGVITGVLLWVLEYIGLGLLLSMVFFGIFIGLILVRVRRDGGNEVTINES
ncbi:hypothetical protein [His 1 virus]|uniref:Structural protein 27 n=1 Tax=His1 virus (isolate Australia/Victoria) TaxID=654912 RepID=VP27_HIS1I|nr:hypothetical protein His1V_gp27 [His 1 virus]Q25BG8.1 RecName: Full=Structural protein 27 [His1 virus (isolate Victoria)]AAQ13746.1 hypothetical protein [His 1 virus]